MRTCGLCGPDEAESSVVDANENGEVPGDDDSCMLATVARFVMVPGRGDTIESSKDPRSDAPDICPFGVRSFPVAARDEKVQLR
jgi:hypothetical protein